MSLTIVPRCLLVVALAFLGFAHAAPVGTWYELDEANGNFTLTYKSKTYNLNASPSTYLDDQVWFYNSNLTPQNPATIKDAVEKRYGLLSGSLTTVGYCDNGGCSGGSMTNLSPPHGTPTSTFNAAQAFDYLAIHLGKGELIFHWTVATNTFTLSGLPTASISNYRAFLGPQVLPTPLPAAALLFASGLGALRLMGRRRNRVHDTIPA